MGSMASLLTMFLELSLPDRLVSVVKTFHRSGRKNVPIVRAGVVIYQDSIFLGLMGAVENQGKEPTFSKPTKCFPELSWRISLWDFSKISIMTFVFSERKTFAKDVSK